jgi:hypothetical protein
MARKLAPAHRTRDGQPIKTTDVARAPARTAACTGDCACAPVHAGGRGPKRPRARVGPYARVGRA